MQRRYLVVFSYCLVLGCCLSRAKTTHAQDAQIEAASVLIRLIDTVEVPAGTAGVLAKVLAVEGQQVDAGELVAQIDSHQPQLEFSRAKIELELTKMQIQNDVSVRLAETGHQFATAAFRRLKSAASSLPGSVSESELEELRHEAAKAQLSLEDARRELALARATLQLKQNDVESKVRGVEICRVNAPLSGTVAQVYRKTGEWVEPGEKVIRIISVQRLRAEGFVPADKVDQELNGAMVELTIEQPGGALNQLDGRVVFVHPQIDPVNGYMRVWAEIDNRDGTLRPGMRAQMKIFPDRPRSGTQVRLGNEASRHQ